MELPKRKPNRLKNYDYSQNGVYFITVCTRNRECIFTVGADIIRPPEDINLQHGIELSECGRIVDESINKIPSHYNGVSVDKYVIMPDHVHMMLRIEQQSGRMVSAPTVIAGMKRYVSKQIGKPVWQKSFYDHVIRDEEDYRRIWQYIEENPVEWETDTPETAK